MLPLFVLETMEEINDAGLFIKSAVQFCVFFNLLTLKFQYNASKGRT